MTFPLSFQSVTIALKMNWPMTRSTDLVHIGILMPNGYSQSGHPLHVLGLHSGNVGKDVPVGKNPAMVQTFLNQFIKVDSNYPTTDFRTSGWVHSTKKQWWSNLTLYAMEYFGDDLRELGLYNVVRTTFYGIEAGVPNFYAIFELYCTSCGTFFAPRHGRCQIYPWVPSHTRNISLATRNLAGESR